MLEFIPKNSDLGNLNIIEVYDFYDVPCLFSCENEIGHVFLSLLVEIEKKSYRYIFIPISRIRLSNLLNKQFELRSIFESPELNYFYNFNLTESENILEKEPISKIQNDWLPLPDQFITGTINVLTRIESAESLAGNLESDVLDIILRSEKLKYLAVPIHILTGILDTFQEFFSSVSEYTEKRINSKLKSTNKTQIVVPRNLNLAYSFSSSYGIRLVSNGTTDLYFDTELITVFQQLIKIIDSGADKDKLRKNLSPLKKRAIKRYKNFVHQLVEHNTSLELNWTSPSRYSRSANINSGELGKLFEILSELTPEESEEFKIIGILIGINVRTKYFEIIESGTNEKFTGHYSDETSESANNATVNKVYHAKLVMTEQGNNFSGSTKIHYTLVSLSDG